MDLPAFGTANTHYRLLRQPVGSYLRGRSGSSRARARLYGILLSDSPNEEICAISAAPTHRLALPRRAEPAQFLGRCVHRCRRTATKATSPPGGIAASMI